MKKLAKEKNKPVIHKKFYKLIKKLKNLNSDQKKLAYFLIFTFAVLILGLVFALNFQQKYNSKKNPYLSDTTEVQNIDILLSKKGFDTKDITLRYGKDYNFRIIKTEDAKCSSISNLELGYTIHLPNIADEFTVRFPETKKYTLECVDSKSFRINITSI